MDELTTTAVLARIPLFQGLSDACLEEVGRGARVMAANKGKKLFYKGDRAESFYYVLEGKVKLAFVSEQGAEKVVEIIGPGMSFGEAVVMLGKPYPVYAEALLATRLVNIRRTEFMHAMEHHNPMALRIIGSLSQQLHRMVSDLESLCLMNSRERVVGYLLRELQEKQGRGEGELQLELPDTKATVASLLNLTPETFSRVIHRLEREAIISLSGRNVTVLDPERLRQRGSC